MAEKELKARIVHKHDTELNWTKAENFIPKKGEIIIYDSTSSTEAPRFKIGDGTNNVNTLPFAGESIVCTTVSYKSNSYVSSMSFQSLVKAYGEGKVLLCNINGPIGAIYGIPLTLAAATLVFSTFTLEDEIGIQEVIISIGENNVDVNIETPDYGEVIDANSTNAVSGKAVAKELNKKMDSYGNSSSTTELLSFYSKGTNGQGIYLIKMGENNIFEIGYVGSNGERLITMDENGVYVSSIPTNVKSIANKEYVDSAIDQKLGVIENGSY